MATTFTQEQKDALLAGLRNFQARNNLPQAQPPSSADKVTPTPEFKTPTQTYKLPDFSAASSAIAGSKSGTAALLKQSQDFYQQQLDLAKQQKDEGSSVVSKLLKGNENMRADAQKNALKQYEDMYGVDFKESIAKRQAAEEEALKLQDDLNQTILRREREVEAARIAQGGTTSGADAAVRAIEKDYATILNSKSVALNSKTAYVEMLQGNVEEAQNFIDKAVDFAVADQRDRVNLTLQAWEMNQGLLNNINSVYKDAFQTMMGFQEKELDRQYAERKEIGDYVLALAKEGIDASSALADPTMTPDRFLQRYGSKLAATNINGGASAGFADSKIEADFRESAVDALGDVEAGILTIDKAYTTLRKLYSPSQVTDQAIKDILDMNSGQVTSGTTTTGSSTGSTKKSPFAKDFNNAVAGLKAVREAQDKLSPFMPFVGAGSPLIETVYSYLFGE